MNLINVAEIGVIVMMIGVITPIFLKDNWRRAYLLCRVAQVMGFIIGMVGIIGIGVVDSIFYRLLMLEL